LTAEHGKLPETRLPKGKRKAMTDKSSFEKCQRYVKRHFHQNIDDPLLYHLIINTDRLSQEEATRLIGDAVLHKFY
jgi:cytidylate kinase